MTNDNVIRFNSIFALAELGDKESAPEIRKYLNDEDVWMRLASINAIVKLGDKESIPEIKKLLNDKDMRYEAEQALKQLGVSEEEIEKAKEKK